MDIINQLFQKNQKKKHINHQNLEREYTDLSDIKMMMQYTQKRIGLGFDEIIHHKKQAFIKKLKKHDIVKKPEKDNEDSRKIQTKEIQKIRISKKKSISTII
ncbi:hypothetical protein pb186bvf_005557 [Paramecium bursaria]